MYSHTSALHTHYTRTCFLLSATPERTCKNPKNEAGTIKRKLSLFEGLLPPSSSSSWSSSSSSSSTSSPAACPLPLRSCTRLDLSLSLSLSSCREISFRVPSLMLFIYISDWIHFVFHLSLFVGETRVESVTHCIWCGALSIQTTVTDTHTHR